MQLPLHALGLLVVGSLQLEKASIAIVAFRVVAGSRVVSKQVPIRRVTRSAAGHLKEPFPLHDIAGHPPACRGWVIQEVPLHDVQVALGDLLAVAVAVGIVLADAGRSLYQAAVLEGLRDKLLSAGVGDEAEAVATQAGERGRIASLQAGMDVKGGRGKSSQRGRDGRPRRNVQMAETENLHLESIACYTRKPQAGGRRNSPAILVHEDRVENRIQIRQAIAIQILEAAEVDWHALARDARR